jgi:hypothetical protein
MGEEGKSTKIDTGIKQVREQEHETKEVPQSVVHTAIEEVNKVPGSAGVYKVKKEGIRQNIKPVADGGRFGVRWTVTILTSSSEIDCGTMTIEIRNGAPEVTGSSFLKK